MIKNINFILITLLLGSLVVSCNKDDDTNDPGDQIIVPEGYSLAWSDEFNNSSINMSDWQYEIGDGTDYGLPAGWGNDEMQLYTDNADNSGIENDGEISALFIRAMNDGNEGFTSAKLTTKGSVSIRFGRVDIKAKMPKGQGIWSAIWMLGDNIDQIDWPGCGEIDVAEILGNEPNNMYSTLHYTNGEHSHREKQDNKELSNDTYSDAYHIFSVDWTPENLTFSVDGMEVQKVPIEDDMKEFLRSFYVVLNVAVGGNWPGSPDNTTVFPQTMYVDYIRVFEKDGFTAPAAPTLDIEEESIGQNIEPGLAQHAIKDGFNELGNATVVAYGAGGEPVVSASSIAIDGDSSLVFNFPGENWGGGYIELESPVDLSSHSTIKFSLNKPTSLVNAEIKLESPSTNAAVFLENYTGTDAGEGYLEYTIPLSDFTGLDLTQISIPFSMWNPVDASQEFVVGTVMIDGILFSN